jgi:hypothetical protein
VYLFVSVIRALRKRVKIPAVVLASLTIQVLSTAKRLARCGVDDGENVRFPIDSVESVSAAKEVPATVVIYGNEVGMCC